MNKKRRYIFLLLFFITCLPLFPSDEATHSQQLWDVLFAPEQKLSKQGYRNFEALEMAIYLCIDLYNGHNTTKAQEYLNELKRFHGIFSARNLPALKIIDFKAGSEHQRYTHRGWDWTLYPRNLREYDFQVIWEIRKHQVYLATIDRIFKFKKDEMIKRDSFAALIYYIHILGDHMGDEKGSYMDRIPISPRPDYRFNRSGENSNNPTIYTELLYHLPRLFRDQNTSTDYDMLVKYLEHNKNKQFSTGTTISDEEYAELKRFAQDTLNRLIRYVPRLLENEPFFTRAFTGN